MVKKDYRQIGVATIIGISVLAAIFYFNSEEEASAPVPVLRPRPPRVTPPVTTETAPETAPETKVEPVAPVTTPTEVPVIVDNVVKAKEDKLAKFKNLIQLDVNLPDEMHYTELDLDDGVAAMEGSSPGKKLLIMGTQRLASPALIAAYLKDQSNQIPMLAGYEFKISGELQNYPPPKNSGISKITVIPGGVHNGNQVFAAYLERGDKKGSYVFVMEANPSQFSQYEGDFDNMAESLKTR